MEELNERLNSETIGIMIQLALTIAGAEETSGELIDLRLKKMDALKEEIQRTYDLYRSIIEADDWSYDESSRFSVFEEIFQLNPIKHNSHQSKLFFDSCVLIQQ